MSREATITINGTVLTEAQSMTLRVAASHFAMVLTDEGLGNDETGKELTSGYLARLGEIFALLHAKERA